MNDGWRIGPVEEQLFNWPEQAYVPMNNMFWAIADELRQPWRGEAGRIKLVPPEFTEAATRQLLGLRHPGAG